MTSGARHPRHLNGDPLGAHGRCHGVGERASAAHVHSQRLTSVPARRPTRGFARRASRRDRSPRQSCQTVPGPGTRCGCGRPRRASATSTAACIAAAAMCTTPATTSSKASKAPGTIRPSTGSAPGNHPYAPRAPLVASLGSFPTSLRRPGTPPCDEESELAPDDPVPSSPCARCRGRRAPPVHQRRGLGAVVSRCPPASPTSSVATWTGRLSPISSFPGQRADPCGPQAGASASDTRRFGRPACHLCVPTIYATRLSPNGSPTGRTRSRSPRSPVTRRSASHSIATGTSSQPRTRS